jgi:transposase
LLIKQRTQLMNSLRAMLAEFGVVAAQGYRGLAALRAHLADEASGLPETLAGRCGVWRRNSTP